MKTFGIITIVVLVILLIYIRFKMIYNRIFFEFGFKGADLSGLNLQGLLNGGQQDATIKMSMKIINNNNFTMSLNLVGAWLYYNGVMIAQTSENLSKNEVTIPSKGTAEIVDDIKITINQQSIDLLKKVVLKNNPKVQYTVKLKLWGIPLTWNDYFIFEV